MSTYDAAIESLYRAALEQFVTERKRLAGELKAAGDKEGSTRLLKLGRPSISAWAVNQLWWQAREQFEELLKSAAAVTPGDQRALSRHREALSRLRERASKLLGEGGHAASDTTMRRISTTLTALAATGGFAPDAPGTLAADRDPPGFEALSFGASAALASAAEAPAAAEAQGAAEAQQKIRQEAVEKARAAEEERARRAAERSAERERLSALLKDARRVQTEQQAALARLREQLVSGEHALHQTQDLLADLERKLDAL
jgi:hypothetical protein